MEVQVRGVTVELRTMKLTRSLLNQARRLRSIPEAFRAETLSHEEKLRLEALSDKSFAEAGLTPEEKQEQQKLANKKYHEFKLNPSYCAGWIAGSVLGEKHDLFLLFVKDGDLFLFNWPGFKPEPWCRQIYVG